MEEVIYSGSPFFIEATSVNALTEARITVNIWQGEKDTVPSGAFERVISKEATNNIWVVDIAPIIAHEIPKQQYTNVEAVWVRFAIEVNGDEYGEIRTYLALDGYVPAGVVQKYQTSAGGGAATLQQLNDGVNPPSGIIWTIEGSNTTTFPFDSNATATSGKFSTGSQTPTASDTVFVDPLYRFTPGFIRFKNSNGILEEFPVGKRVIPSVSAESSYYTRNTIDYNTVTYDGGHVKQQYNTSGIRSWQVSTGWMTEDFNRLVQDFILSDDAWFTWKGETYPINLKNKAQVLKQELNETVIEYSFSIEEARPLNNIIR